MPMIRVRKRNRQRRDDRVRRKALIGIAVTVALSALLDLPDVLAGFSAGPRNLAAVTESPPPPENAEPRARPVSGEINFLSGPTFNGNAFGDIIAPEPGTLGLFGVGIVALIAARRNRRIARTTTR